MKNWLEQEVAQWVHHEGSIWQPIAPCAKHTLFVISLLFYLAITFQSVLHNCHNKVHGMSDLLDTVYKRSLAANQRVREMFYLTTHSTHFIYGYMASDICLRTILIVRKETHCCHIGYSYRLTARVLLYAPSHRQDNTYHGVCYTSRGALAGTRNSSMGPR